MTITGTGFLGPTRLCASRETVFFGSDQNDDYPIPAAPGSVKVLSNTEIRAKAPENFGGTVAGTGEPGTVDIQVYSPRCGLSSANPPADRYSFTYNNDGQCTSSACRVSVDAARTLGPLGHVADGFLNGFTDLTGGGQHATLSPAQIAALQQIHPRWWRFGYPGQTASGRQVNQQLGARTTELLESDYLVAYPGQEPWTDLSQFSSFVKRDVQRYELAGVAPTYWEIWNEPGCAYLTGGPSATVNDYLSMYGSAYLAIRSVDPNAQIVGPSVGSFNTDTSPGKACGNDLTVVDFLRWAASHNYHFAALSYHDEAESPPPADPDARFGRDDYRVSALGAHVRALSSLIAKSYPRLRGLKIFVNEYGSWATLEPGWLVGAFASFEGSGVAEANLTCGLPADVSCNYLVDGLFANTAGTPAMPYWVFDDYATMDGRRVALSSNGTNLTGLAVRRDATRTVQILVGRHDECARPSRPYYGNSGPMPGPPDNTCPEFQVPPNPAAPVDTTLTVKEPYDLTRVHVTLQRLPNSATCEGTAPDLPSGCSTAAVASRPPSDSARLPVSDGLVSIPLGLMHDGDALFVTITPPGAPTAPAR